MAAERWVLVEPGAFEGGSDRLTLDATESRHVATALRLRTGDAITACDGRGALAETRLAVVDSRRCVVEIVGRLPRQDPPWPSVTVALGVLHSQAMDWAVQKCVEVGAAGLVPVLSERSQLAAGAARGRLGHWHRVARQALKQCRRSWEMEVADPMSLGDLVTGREEGTGLVADPQGRSIGSLTAPLPDLLVVGPEGGLADAELRLLADAGWPGVRLGPWVLRADTAAVVGAAALLAAHERVER